MLNGIATPLRAVLVREGSASLPPHLSLHLPPSSG
jgi:hypothetical protein